MLDSEALSCRDIARMCSSKVTERQARSILTSRLGAGETGVAARRTKGTWLATLGWWLGAGNGATIVRRPIHTDLTRK